MTDMERNLRQHMRKESDEMLFNGMELSEQTKMNVRKQAAAESKGGSRFALPKVWLTGAAAVVAAVAIVVSWPSQQEEIASPATTPTASSPSDITTVPGGGAAGSELSQLITTPFATAEAAKAAFGAGLLVPQAAPEGLELAEIVGVGMAGEPLRDVVFTYGTIDKSVTFIASRMESGFPADMFTETLVGGVEAFIFEQETYTELFWVVDGIHYGVSGPIAGDEAMKLAESATP